MYEAYALIRVLQPVLLALAVILLGIASLNDIAVRTIPNLAPFGCFAWRPLRKMACKNN
jgi:hypothetical protein